ncbi:LacI family transcriptional regulator [Planosporangium thailandense]|uniref:LacI family transcriptional regulator n=2 Tax=Planosporangium thailandense TaxID=765197 RepID=A0ABX0XT64_9ACTN|nr:LacI family transcriptional regulator [Planosporangium thailandense]
MPEQRSRAGRATIRDVAREAGVSVTTVSHALNGKGTASEATRRRVLAVAERLAYRAHPMARGLRRGRTGVLGLDMRPLDAIGSYLPVGVDYFVRFAGAAAVTALDHGLGLMLVPDLTRPGIPTSAHGVDGYVIGDPVRDDQALARLLDAGVPVVTVGRDPGRPDFTDWVGSDDVHETQRVLDLMRQRGAERVAFIAGTDDNAWNVDAERAYRAWAGRHHLPVRVLRVPEATGEDGGRDAARQLLDGPKTRPDAIYCQTGRHAAGVLAEAQHLGVAVPRDLLLAAGSDAQQTRLATPGITALDLEPEETGKAAVQLLIARLNGEPATGPVYVPARLHERGSTGAR